MRRHSEIWTVAGLCRRQAAINPQPAYQRGPVWTVAQKQLLIDSILRDLDVPKLYLREVAEGDFVHEVIDGQQRMRAVTEFRADRYPLAPECDAIPEHRIAGRTYSELPDEVQDRFDQYELHFVILRDASQDEVEEMFLRLQNGTTLKAAEKRNAMPGRMGDFVRELTRHPFFVRLPFPNYRFTHDELAAQMTLLELEGGPADVRSRRLERMYEEHREFDFNGLPARKVRRTLDLLARSLPGPITALQKTTALSLYLMTSRLLDTHVLDGRESELGGWFMAFLREQESDELQPEDRRDPRSVLYQEHCNRRTSSEESIRYRHEYLTGSFLLTCPDLERSDRKPYFTAEQKLAVWLRDHGRCRSQIACRGKRMPADHCEVEAVTPFASGGRPTVDNARLVCPDCARAAYAVAS
jgi:hypothetical protein